MLATLIIVILAAAGAYAWWTLYRWERLLRGARIAISYNTRPQMQPTLLDLLNWAKLLDKEKDVDVKNRLVNGKTFYRNGKMSVSIVRPRAGKHGAVESITRAPKADGS
jgi:hypothetical protein